MQTYGLVFCVVGEGTIVLDIFFYEPKLKQLKCFHQDLCRFRVFEM